MCRICDQEKSYIRKGWYGQLEAVGGEALGLTGVHYQKAGTAGRYAETDAFSDPDGVGDKLTTQVQSPTDLALAAAVIDDIPNNASTHVTLTVGGPRVISTINTVGDQDWFRVELQAGVTYEFGQYGTRNGASGVKLPDAWVEIYDANGNRLAFSDGGAPHDSLGLDALLTFTATTSGTYYVNARAFDDVPTNGRTGDFVGDYEVFARVSNYRPYYDLNSPLHSLDWGTQFDGTSRNPDNAEGPRPTGNPVENKIGGKNVIYVYFAREGEVFVDNAADPLNLTTTIVAKGVEQWEKNAFNYVFEEFEKVADIDYIETDNRWEADIVIITYDGTPGPGASLLGRMSPPDTPSEGQTEYNSGDYRWTQEGLAPGGFYFGTLIHEFGHGHGMSHPHDTGGKSSVMRDDSTESGYVEETSPFNYTLGTGNLNQSVYTMMSYMDGWQLSPYGQPSSSAGYGFIGSLMALDIAVIQDKYGVNEEWATGDDVYVMADVNQKAAFDENGNQTQQATMYRSIWDAGGTDSIVYNGARDANIDLRPATLRYEEGGGGWISYAFGIHGGYTIANGVTIENASSGGGNDTLRGNAANNRLDGGAGNDRILLHDGGDDVAIGGAGNDTFYVGGALTSADAIDGGADRDALSLQGQYGASPLALGAGVVNLELITLLSGTDTRYGLPGTDSFSYNLASHDANVAAGITMIVDAGQLKAGENLTFNGSAETDGSFKFWGGEGVDLLTGGSQSDFFFFAENRFGASDVVNGGAGAAMDQISLRGNYNLTFGAAQLNSIEMITLLSGRDSVANTDYQYNLTTVDANVAAGVRMIVDAAQLRAAEGMTFNGSAETDGRFWIFGGKGNDNITGGAGNDTIQAGLGKDYMNGGAGADVFTFKSAAESTGVNYDTIDGFVFGTDTLDLPGTHDSYEVVSGGLLSTATFDTDLATAMAATLGANEAVLFTATVGDLAGRLFLVVDQNGTDGYQSGEDFVIELANTSLPVGPIPDFIV